MIDINVSIIGMYSLLIYH